VLQIIGVTEALENEIDNSGRSLLRIAMLAAVFGASVGFPSAASRRVRRFSGRPRETFFHAKSACVHLALIPNLNQFLAACFAHQTIGLLSPCPHKTAKHSGPADGKLDAHDSQRERPDKNSVEFSPGLC
jgi:hypothetical protein